MNNTGIYQIRNTVNGNSYIGSALNIKRRFTEHRSHLKKNKHHSQYLQHAWNKYGKDNFIFEVIEYCESNALVEREQYYLDNFDCIYNLHKNAYSCLGRILSEKTKNKIRNSLLGITHSEERKVNQSIAQKNRIQWGRKPLTQEQKNKIKSIIKKPLTEKQKATISKVCKGGKKKILQFTCDGNFITEWESIRECSRNLGISRNCLRNMIKNTHRCWNNFRFQQKIN